MSLFQSARFVLSVASLDGLPPSGLPEIAFAGRSNSGKSTTINVLARQKRLAFASKTPGRTQLLNFFELSQKTGEPPVRTAVASFVDLPGYGFAKTPAATRETWGELVGGYLATRESLAGLVVVMDARRPLMPADNWVVAAIGGNRCPIHLLLNKADQIKASERRPTLARVRAQAAEIGPHVTAQLFSGLKREGVDELEQTLLGWLGLSGRE